MSIFGKILERLGLGHAHAATPGPTPTGSVPTMPASTGAASPPTVAPPKPVPVVDVVAQLEQKAKASGEKLNWRTSIVDLLKLLDLDSSLESRKALAKELGTPPELIGGDYSRMNIWLHKAVLEKIAANGGNVPKDLLDNKRAA
jgi:hypothetical protein